MTHNAIQRLLLKRFALAAATYGLALLLLWLAFFTGHYQQSLSGVAIGSALVVITQATLFGLFWSGRNLRFSDPSLTEVQVLLGLGWQTWLIAHLDEARGAFLVFYVLILLFGLFHLSRRAFIRCALLVFFSFCAITLWDGYYFRLREPALAALQACILAMVLAWLVLYARFVQVSRQRQRQRRFALQAHQDTLRGMMRQLEDLVATDELTGLFNRRHFLRLASRELNAMDNDVVHGLALIDLDHFKRINDNYGHLAGDKVLKIIATVLRKRLRGADFIARFGGEEFVLLLPNTPQAAGIKLLQSLRAAIEACPFHFKGEPVTITASIGVSAFRVGEHSDVVLKRADQALYRAKDAGRNRVEPG